MKRSGTHTVSLFDAKTHLSKLLEEVQSGNVITITKRGTPVAQLVPYKTQHDDTNISGSFQRLASIRKKLKGKVPIQQYIREGRRY